MVYDTVWCRIAIPALTIPFLVGQALLPVKSVAAPAKAFVPHLDQIQRSLPPNFAMRLPQQILLGDPADEEFVDSLTVQVLPSTEPRGMSIALYSCNPNSPLCWIGTFSVASADSASAQASYRRHQMAAPIQLNDTIRAYVLEEPRSQPPSQVSSMMWQQDRVFYTIQFASPERQNMLYMAVSMVNSEPIYALNPILRDLPSVQRPTPPMPIVQRPH